MQHAAMQPFTYDATPSCNLAQQQQPPAKKGWRMEEEREAAVLKWQSSTRSTLKWGCQPTIPLTLLRIMRV
jgi:hypothetical protein